MPEWINDFLDLAKAFLWGVIQHILLLAPIVEPMVCPVNPPQWWYRCWGWTDWYFNLDPDYRPTSALLDLYWSCIWMHAHDLVDESAEWFSGLVDSAIRVLLGTLSYLYNSFAQWIDAVQSTLGFALPWWCVSAIDGLNHLWGWLPEEIRQNILAWWQIWEQIKQDVRDWAINFYHDTVQFALDAWNWIIGLGQSVYDWWYWVKDFLWNFAFNAYLVITGYLGSAWDWLTGFAADPVGYVLSYLSPWWQPLVTFASDCLAYWYNLWGVHAARLWEFLDSPLDWLFDRAEQFLADKLE